MDIEEHEETDPASVGGKEMSGEYQIINHRNQGERSRVNGVKNIFCLFLVLILGLLLIQCSTTKEELHTHEETVLTRTYPKDYVHPLTEINLEKVINENRGLQVLEENATTAHDYYRGGVQEKAQGERLMKEGKWEEARTHLEKSNWFLKVVLKYFPEDNAYRNIYGNHVIIFLPNLLIADNYLKLAFIYNKIGRKNKIAEIREYGKYYLSQSLKSVKTEWAFQVEQGLEGGLSK